MGDLVWDASEARVSWASAMTELPIKTLRGWAKESSVKCGGLWEALLISGSCSDDVVKLRVCFFWTPSIWPLSDLSAAESLAGS